MYNYSFSENLLRRNMNQSANNQNPEQDSPRTGELVAWCFGYIVVGALAILGNSVTIAVFMKRTFKRKKLHYLLINLAVTDLTVGAISVPIQIAILASDIQQTHLDKSVWPAHFFFDVLSGLASMYSIAFIAVERFIAVTWPLKHRLLKPWHYAVTISFTWIIAFIPAVTSRTVLPNHVGKREALDVRTTFAIIPIVITIAAYCLLLLIRRKQESGSRLDKYNKSVACTLLIVTIVFVCTWCPFILLTSIVGYASFPHLSQCCSLTKEDLTLAVDFTKLLQYSNSCVNPFIYALRIKSFRVIAWDILFCGKIPRPNFIGSFREVTSSFTNKTVVRSASVDVKTCKNCAETENETA